MTNGSTDAVGARVAAANDDHVLAASMNRSLIRLAVENGLGTRGEVVHREMHAVEIASFHRQIARLSRTGADHDRIEVLAQKLCFDVVADIRVADEFHAFLFHQLDATLDDFFLVELHVRNAVHEQAAGTIRTFEHRHRMTCAIQLSGRCKSRRTRADHSDFLAGAILGLFRNHPAFVPPLVDDGSLDRLDRNGRIVDSEHARPFARRGTHAAREFREVVGHVQAIERLTPQAAIDQIVPFRNHVVDRAAGSHSADQLARVTERHAAVHAAGGLIAQTFVFHVVMEFFPVAHAFLRRAIDGQLAQVFDESGRLSHKSLSGWLLAT